MTARKISRSATSLCTVWEKAKLFSSLSYLSTAESNTMISGVFHPAIYRTFPSLAFEFSQSAETGTNLQRMGRAKLFLCFCFLKSDGK